MKIDELLKREESKTLEFKRDVSSLAPILKTIVAFANTAGGVLIIGRSPEGKITGVKDVCRAEEALANAIADSIAPSLLPEIEIATRGGKELLIVRVSYWKAPFYIKKEGKPRGVYVRLGSTSRPASGDLLMELERTTLNLSFDQQAVLECTPADLDKKKIEAAFPVVRKSQLSSLGILTKHGRKDVPTVGGFILFGKDEKRLKILPEARVSCARFQGTTKSKIIDRQDIDGSVLEAVEEVRKFIRRNTKLSSDIKGFRRKDIPEYPEVALREAFINAIAHCDYVLKGSHIQVAIFDNRLEIQSPGMFPFGFTIEDFKSGVSRIRNRVIVRILRELKLMEEWGSGYRRIIETCRQKNYPDPRWEELSTTIRVTFFPYSEELQKKSEARKLKGREGTILELFQENPRLSFREIYTRLSGKVSERTLRYDLAKLHDKGLLAREGKGPSTMWVLLDQ